MYVHSARGGSANVLQLHCFLATMEPLVEIGILQQSDEDRVYEKILARIAKSDVSSTTLSVTVVHALSKLVFLVKNKWKDKVPTTKLTKKQFVHILAYICDRNSTLEEHSKICIKVPNYAYKPWRSIPKYA